MDQYNSKLSKIKILARGNSLSLRGRLPNKNGDGTFKRYTIALSLPNTPEGLKLAFAKAQALEADLMLERFSWKGQANKLTVEEAISIFEKDYWNKKKKTVNRVKNYKSDYLDPFLYLPQDELLTEDLLLSALLTTEPDSRQRLRFAIAYRALARVNRIDADFSQYKGNYEPKVIRKIPTETEIEQYYQSISNPAWRWVFGIIATFGIRPHEIFWLDVSKLEQYPPILQVGNTTKTKYRLVYPIPNDDWVKKWELFTPQLPNVETNGKSNKELGTKIGQGFWERKIPSPYHFRDAYAIRGVIYNFNPANVAKWMGHSLDVHEKKYLRHMEEKHFTEAWCKNQKQR